ncbi:MAG: hypothetical protein ACTMIK_04145 [Galactobacter sp.]
MSTETDEEGEALVGPSGAEDEPPVQPVSNTITEANAAPVMILGWGVLFRG